MRRTLLLLLAACIVAAAWTIWHRAGRLPIQAGLCRGCNLLLVTIDTLRSDRVGAFGGPSDLTPTLDRLAAEGVRFGRTYSSAPLTLPSHASMMTAVSPPLHGVRTNGLFRLGPSLPTLASILKSRGYRTGAFIGAFVLDARFGLNRGFDTYDDNYGEKHSGDPLEEAQRSAEDVIKPALKWILGDDGAPRSIAAAGTSASAPWFVWVHLYDPHEPYRAPEPYASAHAPYEAEVAYADAMLGVLLDQLRRGGQLDRTLAIVVADHGESLGEHGERTHGVFAYEATLRVPWIMWADRLKPRLFDALARLIDLAPTALDLLGLPPSPTFEGRSLVAAMNGAAEAPLTAYFEAMDANLTRNWAPLAGVISGGYKLIDLPEPELYDVANDPQEMKNLYASDGMRARTLAALLRDLTREYAAKAGTASERTTLDTEARRRLQALGYVATGVERAGIRTYTEADDPKALIGVSNDLNRALGEFRAGAIARSMNVVRAIVRDHPTFTTAYGVLASMQRERGDLTGAIATLEEPLRRGIADQSTMVVLAGYLQEAGALGRSKALLQAVLDEHPDYVEAWNSLGVVESRQGRHVEAQDAFRKALELDATAASVYLNRGADAVAAGDLASATAYLQRALELDPNLPAAHNAMAAVLQRLGRRDDALEHWRVCLRLNPRMYDALYNIGTVLYSANRREEARPYLERFVDEAPRDRYQKDVLRIRELLKR